MWKRKTIASISTAELKQARSNLLKSKSAHEEAEAYVSMYTKRIARLNVMRAEAAYNDATMQKAIETEIYASEVELLKAKSAMEYAHSDIVYNSLRIARLDSCISKNTTDFPPINAI